MRNERSLYSVQWAEFGVYIMCSRRSLDNVQLLLCAVQWDRHVQYMPVHHREKITTSITIADAATKAKA